MKEKTFLMKKILNYKNTNTFNSVFCNRIGKKR